VREEVTAIRRQTTLDIAQRMHLIDASSSTQQQEEIIPHLEQKLHLMFQEYSLKIFQYSDSQINDFLLRVYRPKCEEIVSMRDGALEEFEDNISTNDFKRFFRAVFKLTLHMVLNDPPIMLSMESWTVRKHKTQLTERYDFWMYNKNDYYCIDGFP